MLYYSIELKKHKKPLSSSGKHDGERLPRQRAAQPVVYSEQTIESMNNRFYSEYVLKNKVLFFIANEELGTLYVYAAVRAGAYTPEQLEEETLSRFSGCVIGQQRELTLDEYKRSLEQADYGSSRKIISKLKIDYRSGSVFDPCPYSWTECVLDPGKMTEEECSEKAEMMLSSKSMKAELGRIYSPLNKKAYYGHPVHYYISAGEWGAAQDMYELLIGALASNGRLCSNRLSVFRNFKKGAYRDERLRHHVSASEGGIIIMELCCDTGMSQYASDQFELVKVMGSLLEELKKDTLFIVVEIMGKSVKNADVLSTLLNKADFIQVTEGSGGRERAKEYLNKLVSRSDIEADDPTEPLKYLPDKESYSVSDIFRAYTEWYGSGLKNHIYKSYKQEDICRVEVHESENKAGVELSEMIGLTDVKTVVKKIISAGRIKCLREKMGLANDSISLNMMFTGNPGTAKTTVARLLARILKEEDIIKTGNLVECGRQDLIARYVGWTAKTIEEKFREADGGVLFIDEAYSLVEDTRSFANEAIDTITQCMENFRDRVIVIFAGYPDKMKLLLDENEGLRSRISFHLNFPDYSCDELVEILRLHASLRDYSVSDAAVEKCRGIFKEAAKNSEFGNGRYVRNLLEQAIIDLADRLIERGGEITADDVRALDAEDFCPVRLGFEQKQDTRVGFAV